MLLDSAPKLEDIVVAILARHPGSDVKQLHKLIARTYGEYSVPAIYQELRKLREKTVVVKVGSDFSLRLGWVLEIMDLTDLMYAAYVSESEITKLLPERGKKQSWQFRNLRSLGRFWTQVILTLLNESSEKRYFEWAPHTWYSLTHGPEETQFIRALLLSEIELYLIIGHETLLNKHYAKEVSHLLGEVSFAAADFPLDTYYSLVGDYFITVKLSPQLESAIDEVFGTTKKIDLPTVSEAVSLLDVDAKIKITLEHKPQKAAKWKRVFYNFFGLTED